ncbi:MULTISPECIES: hypothetical protein [Chryseobacterium]|uniref:hypothetical protein n=1 Tax=Chryseobacterium TaxID=59732 RepID=UPI000AA10307|nr:MULTISPECIES: hypothetical protein [Chryseobacterium]MBF6646657.1 hypothetical protein [Chryseobacterium indologenes]MBU3047870.1 hypothetical protein [Chryseobacterium indologenes]MEB4760506.1 hypothetical protein [Chryseobacterium indologenes]QIX80877.1 hypothetical protein FOB56_06335 [Chryseobacterium indologenes]QQQ69683.1 hypothetical protein JHW31_14335 [Chryseobacterium indologenes]
MKTTSIQKRKLNKKDLKEIKGAGPHCPVVFSCFDRNTGEEQTGVPGIQDGLCC